MVEFSDCKINIGLDILRRREDGYHEIDTCMVHVPWHDVIEIVAAAGTETTLTVLGRQVDCPPEANLVMRAYRALAAGHSLPPVDIVLQKIVPDGAGLGGGSSDATHTLRLLDKMYSLGLGPDAIARVAARLGADCPFFAYDTPMMAAGIGEKLTPITLPLQGYTMALVKPTGIAISTRQAYAGVTPCEPETPLRRLLETLPVEQWQGRVVNAFEQSIFPLAPEIGRLKRFMLQSGAVYASMSGSGASVYGLFVCRADAEKAAHACPDYPSLVHTF